MENDDETLLNVAAGDAVDETTGTDADRGDEVELGEGQTAAVDGADEGAVEATPEARPLTGIPKARFNEVNEERKAALRANEEKDRVIAELLLRTGGAPATASTHAAPAFDEVAKEREYLDALLEDGDRDKALAIRREINAYREEATIARYRSLQSADQTLAALDVVTQQTLQDYPFLDTPEGEDVLEAIVGLRDRKIASGIAPHLALAQAVKAIAPAFAPQGESGTADKTDRRTAAAVARGVADSGRQPPSLRGMGNRTTAGRIDVASMTEEQYDSLPESERKRLRGDTP